jgi:hypothetical protein
MISKLQIDLLLTALSALLPLIPDKHRDKAASILETAGGVADAAVSIGAHWGDLAQRFASLRSEIAAMGARAVTPDEMDQALQRVREASAAFRAALETAPAP